MEGNLVEPVDGAAPLECRLIIDPPASGAHNMAVDEALLARAADAGIATLRFYEWTEPTLSLGYFQRYDDRLQHAASRACPALRRQTGGGAILHDRELTYSIALPGRHPLAQDTQQLYRRVHRAIIDVLERVLKVSNGAKSLKICEVDSPCLPREEPFLCFQRRAAGDVILLTAQKTVRDDVSGQAAATSVKIAGSAQRRWRGAILQHGSLLLETSAAAPELPGLMNGAVGEMDRRRLVSDLSARLADLIGTARIESRLPAELQMAVAALTVQKYDSPAWTKRR
jgi:lipoate-protein ligase A